MIPCAAKHLNSEQRKTIALQVVSNSKTITESAKENKTSRKFIKTQTDQALIGIDRSFREHEDKILFYLPITKPWIRQAAVAFTLFCKASYRNTQGLLDYLFHYKMSLGTVFNTLSTAGTNAAKINKEQDLSKIKEGSIDEMFLNNNPILTGIDLHSTYCFLLKEESDREGDTWEKNLLELKDRGLDPNKFIADFGSGLRMGLDLAYNDTPCNGDVFHVLFNLKNLSRYFKNRVKSRNTIVKQLSEKLEKAKKPEKIEELNRKIDIAKKDAEKFSFLSSNISTLVDWMAHDVLSIAGSDPKSRSMLYDFIVEELKALEAIHHHRIRASRIALENQKNDILAFTFEMDQEFSELAKVLNIAKEDVWEICELHRCERFSEKYYKRSKRLRNLLGGKQYVLLMGLVGQIIKTTTRASSLIENLNGRIRPFCNLRKQMGTNFSELLKFFLNHNPLVCSRKKDRKNKTPSEILNQKKHPHWLEMLGFEPVQPVAFI